MGTQMGIVALYSVQAVLHVGFCILLGFLCFESKLRFGVKATVWLAVGFVAVSVLVIELFVERTAPFTEYKFRVEMLWLALAVGVVALAIRVSLFLVFFVVSFFMGTVLKLSFLCKTIASLPGFPKGEIAYILLSILVLAAAAPFMWFLINRLFKKVVELNVTATPFQWLFVLPLAYLFVDALIGSGFYISRGWLGLAALLLSGLAVYLSYVAVMQMFLKMHESMMAQTHMQLAEQMVTIQKEQYQQMVEGMDRSARAEHDFRHHLIVIQDLADQNDLAGLNRYLAEFARASLPEDSAPVCNLHLVDLVMRHYIARARAGGIPIKAAAQFPAGFAIPEHELCVLFGNLLENALESCQRQREGERFITLETDIISSYMLTVHVRNSYSGRIQPRGDLFQSSKRSGLGVGVSTIRHIAQKNEGSCIIRCEDGVFSVRLLLIAPEG